MSSSFFILRIMYINIVHADCWDWNPGRFLLSEPIKNTPTISERKPQNMKKKIYILLIMF